MGKRSELTPFGRQVKIRLLERGMDASELARRVGTSPVQISRILHGKRPGREQIPKIASELGIELDEGAGGAGFPHCTYVYFEAGHTPATRYKIIQGGIFP